MIARATLTDTGREIAISAPYQAREICRSLPGRRWSPETKTWRIPATPAAARALARRFDGHLEPDQAVRTLIARARQEERAAEAPPPETVPGLQTEAWAHQRRAYAFVERHEAALLAMGMGSGKSLVVVGDVCARPEPSRTLILCPLSVVPVWVREFERHAGQPVRVTTLEGSMTKKVQALQRGEDHAYPARRVYVVNHESAWRGELGREILAREWDLVVVDESHRGKGPGTRFGRFLGELRKRAHRRLCLTGTPMSRGPLDLYSQYRFLDPGVFGTSFVRFRARYAVMGGYQGHEVVGYQREEEFEELAGRIMFQVRTDDVLDLPPATHVERYCELSPEERRVYRDLERELVAEVQDGAITASNALVRLLRLAQVAGGHCTAEDGSTLEIGRSKEDLLREVLEEIGPEPVIVFCRFREELRRVRRVCKALGRDARELSGERKDVGSDWLEGEGDTLAVQIQAGGVGVSFTRARYCVYYSVGYSLTDYEQSLARVRRPGQENPVTYIHLVARRTIDEAVYGALLEKKDLVERTLDALRGVR